MNWNQTNQEKTHLYRPGSVWLSDAQVDEASHRQTHIEPVAEAEIVDELEHVLHTEKDQTHQPLQPHSTSYRECSNTGHLLL